MDNLAAVKPTQMQAFREKLEYLAEVDGGL